VRAVIADDSSIQRQIAQTAFRDCGIEIVAICEDGKQAIEAIIKYEPDIALLDFMMPYHSGGEVCEKVHELGLKTRCIMATSMGQEAAAYSSTLRAYGVVVKPYTPQLLAEAVASAFT
jgi:CheY-like chemotaxis protein